MKEDLKFKFSLSSDIFENICDAIFFAYSNSEDGNKFSEAYEWAKFRMKLIDSSTPNLINIFSDHAVLVIGFYGKRFEFVIDLDQVDTIKKYKWNLVFAKDKYYAQTKIDGKYIFLHKLISGISGLNGNRFNVSHKDKNPFNNRKSNLEVIVMSIRRLEEAIDTTSKNSSTGRKGVCLSPNSSGPKYYAYGTENRKQINLGFFDDIDEAAEVAKKFRIERIKKEIEKDKKDLEEWQKKQEKENTKNQ